MTDEDLKALFEASAAETRRTNEETRRLLGEAIAETRQQIVVTNAETRRVLGEAIGETRQQIVDSRLHFDITAEGLRHEIRLVAEKVTGVDERLTREAADIRGEMRQGFADTQAMIKFSHAELDRRVTSLEDGRRAVEETVADLQARVERLEGSTH
ncbi:MAG: hypothetical protein M3P06_13175 [Acidobacteriota bacterium]|nr:hypothetical protein [Acidobacteriota bacterium]